MEPKQHDVGTKANLARPRCYRCGLRGRALVCLLLLRLPAARTAAMTTEDSHHGAEVAAVVSYIRTAWGNRGAPVSAREANELRAAPLN